MTQSTCAGGFGGITVCSMKPGNVATAVLISLLPAGEFILACRRAPGFA